MNTLQKFEAAQLAKLQAARETPEFGPGDTVRVNVRVVEGERERIQDDAARRRKVRSYTWRQRRFGAPRALKVLMPWYDPRPRVMQEPTRRVLDAYDAGGSGR